MKKILITGFSGFVSSHFVEFLYNNHIECEVYGIARHTPSFDYNYFSDFLSIKFYQIDLMSFESLKETIKEIHPDYVLHLAAFSSVAYSWKHPSESFTNNSNIFLNLIEAIREVNPECRVLSIGSSEEYGNVRHEELPLREIQLLDPISPYAVARVSQELLSKIYVEAYGMHIIMTRSFNHIGPRQDDRFVVPSFINRILEIKRNGQSEGTIETGDTTIIRDFVDVRDVVRAYYMLFNDGKAGEIYNICSGTGVKLSQVIEIIAEEVGIKVNTKVNSQFVRPNDNKEIVGSYYKIETELGWKPEIKIQDTVHDMVAERIVR